MVQAGTLIGHPTILVFGGGREGLFGLTVDEHTEGVLVSYIAKPKQNQTFELVGLVMPNPKKHKPEAIQRAIGILLRNQWSHERIFGENPNDRKDRDDQRTFPDTHESRVERIIHDADLLSKLHL